MTHRWLISQKTNDTIQFDRLATPLFAWRQVHLLLGSDCIRSFREAGVQTHREPPTPGVETGHTALRFDLSRLL